MLQCSDHTRQYMQSNAKANRRPSARVLPAAVVVAGTLLAHGVLPLVSSNYSFYDTCALDRRSIAVGRILLGAIVLKDLLSFRYSVIDFMYTGFWSRKHVLDGDDPQVQGNDFSPYLAVGGATGMKICFFLVGIAAVAMMIGWRTHWSIFICWFHTRAIHLRSSGTAQAGDQFLRLVLFWIMFLPCEQVYSLDSWSSHVPVQESNSSCSLATFGVMVQVVMVYQFSSMFKVHEKWTSGSAVYYVLQNFGFAYGPVAEHLLEIPRACLTALTYGTLMIETTCPLFMFLTPQVRGVGVLVFITFHTDLYCSMRLSSFPLICIAAWVLMVPSSVWDGQLARFHEDPTIQFPNDVSWEVYVSRTVIQLTALYLATMCNLNTLPQVGTSMQRVFKMSESGYQLARLLGVQQQWFLFDKPNSTSFWFRIVGHLKDSKGMVDLHQVMVHRNDPQIQEYPVKYAPFTSKQSRLWGACYTSHRWRKLYQRLSDKGNRYKAFQARFAESLVELWNVSKYRDAFGEVRKVSCVGVWTQIPSMSSAESSQGWVAPSSAEAWSVRIDSDGKSVQSRQTEMNGGGTIRKKQT